MPNRRQKVRSYHGVQMALKTKVPDRMRAPDVDLVNYLRRQRHRTVEQLTEVMGVTATAVRQRLDRLMEAGLVDRTPQKASRGRPSHQYHLTEAGQRSGGNNLGDLAVALWSELQQLPDAETRRTVIAGAARRLANKYNRQVESSVAVQSNSGSSSEARARELVSIFAGLDIPVEYDENDSGLPLINIDSCPYPQLADESRDICELETKMMTAVIGTEMKLCQCRRDGDNCCSFRAAD